MTDTSIDWKTRQMIKASGWPLPPDTLAPGTDFNAAQANGLVPLHWAVQGGKPGLLEYLLAQGADVNATPPGGHGLLGLRARWTQVLPAGRLELQARIDNLANRVVAGSVIVSDANGRFFEPAPPRAGLVSLRWAVTWP
jgi:hypothetical protein